MMISQVKEKLKNTGSFPEEKLELLVKDFEKLSVIDENLKEKIICYIIDGEGEEVLNILSNIKGCATDLGLLISGVDISENILKARKTFFKHPDIKHGDIYLRLARVYEAAARKDKIAYTYQTVKGFEGFKWLQIFLLEVTSFKDYYSNRYNFTSDFPVEIIEKLLLLAGHSEEFIVKIPISMEADYYWYVKPAIDLFKALKGFAGAIIRHKESVEKHIKTLNSNLKVQALRMMQDIKIPPEEFLEMLVSLSVESAKTVRAEAEKLLYNIPDKVTPLLKKICKEGKSSERLYAVKLLWKLSGEKEQAFIKELEKTEKSKKIIQAISEMAITVEKEKEKIEELSLPELKDISSEAPLGEETLHALEELFNKYNKIMKAEYEKRKHHPYVQKPPVMKKKEIEKLFKEMQSLVIKDIKKFKPVFNPNYYWNNKIIKMIKTFLERKELNLIQVVRFLFLTGNSGYNEYSHKFQIGYNFEGLINHYRKHHKPGFTLRELAQVFKVIGADEKSIGLHKLDKSHGNSFRYERDAVWPYFLEHIDLVEDAFELRPSEVKYTYYYDKSRKRNNGYEILEKFPYIPSHFENKLMEIAMGTPKSERPKARKCLRNVPHIKEKILTRLSSGKQETRALAAEWLAELGDKKAISHIEKALKSEKNILPKGAFMSALERLGVPVEKFLDRKKLQKEAEKTVKKGVPKGLEWFPFTKLPKIHWKDTGEAIPEDIIKHFIFKCNKLKSPEPDSLTRLYCSYFDKKEKEELGKFIIESWLLFDTIPAYSYEEAYKKAKEQAQSSITWYPKGTTIEELTKNFLKDYIRQCKGSAIKQKGVLALVAACGGSDSVSPVENYLRKWHGHRVHQCKALIAMLSWIEEPSAIQVLLSVANRFRTKGIQKEADKYVNEMAERKGWTVDELADRTIPTAGFDEKKKMELDYGSRKFTVSITDDYKLEIHTEEGKKIKSLPSPRKADDQELVKEAKKILKNSKKELTGLLRLQRERFYEAMCTERQWKFEDWNNFLNSHPIIGSYCRSIIWVAFENNKLIKTFRPLDDGTLTDYEDEEVTLTPEAIIKIAHATNIPSDTEKGWMEHINDYEIKPLFQQLGSEFYRLPEEKKEDTEIRDFEGHMLDSFALRGEATKRGYTRGTPQDAGWFYDYRKSFPGLSLEAVIEFTGNFVPEENRPVALIKLSFESSSKEEAPSFGYGIGRTVSLDEIPSVLLSECYNDLKQIAAKGTGYDKDWEKKSEY